MHRCMHTRVRVYMRVFLYIYMYLYLSLSVRYVSVYASIFVQVAREGGPRRGHSAVAFRGRFLLGDAALLLPPAATKNVTKNVANHVCVAANVTHNACVNFHLQPHKHT